MLHRRAELTNSAAVITPSSDPFSLFFMAVPMYLFYEIAIVPKYHDHDIKNA